MKSLPSDHESNEPRGIARRVRESFARSFQVTLVTVGFTAVVLMALYVRIRRRLKRDAERRSEEIDIIDAEFIEVPEDSR